MPTSEPNNPGAMAMRPTPKPWASHNTRLAFNSSFLRLKPSMAAKAELVNGCVGVPAFWSSGQYEIVDEKSHMSRM
jgi:hypothetical protein